MTREYSTKNIDRILRQEKAIIANKKPKKGKAVVSGAINFKSPEEGFIDAYITDDMLFGGGFEGWLKEKAEQHELDENLDFNRFDYKSLYEKYGRWYDDELEFAYRDIYDNIKPEIEDFNDTLEIYEIQILGGYYEGLQLHADEKSDWYLRDVDYDAPEEEIDEIEQKTKEIERKKVNKFLVRMAKEYGFQLSEGYGWTGASNMNMIFI